jgi:hypothetical protein
MTNVNARFLFTDRSMERLSLRNLQRLISLLNTVFSLSLISYVRFCAGKRSISNDRTISISYNILSYHSRYGKIYDYVVGWSIAQGRYEKNRPAVIHCNSGTPLTKLRQVSSFVLIFLYWFAWFWGCPQNS